MDDEIRVDMRETTPEALAFYKRQRALLFRFNHAQPDTDEYEAAMRDL